MSWDEVKLKDLGKIYTGSTPSTTNDSYFGGEFPFITPSELDLNEPIIQTPRTLTQAGVEVSTLIPKDAVMVCCIGSLGKIGIAGRSMVTNQQINSIVFDKAKVDARYGFYACRRLKSKLISIAPATTVPIVNKTRFSELTIPLPSLAEQQRIAAILDKAELIKRKREFAIEKLDELAQSIFIEMFGNPDINPKNFKEESLLEFFKFKTGKLDSNAASVDGIYPFFTCAKEDFFIDKYAFDEEALLLAGNNANADYSVKHFKGKFNAYQRTYVINLADSRNSYIYAKDCLEFKLKELKHVSKGSSTKYLTMGIFKKMKLLVPPIELQQEYSSRILNLRQSKEIMLKDLSICNALDASIQNNFFNE